MITLTYTVKCDHCDHTHVKRTWIDNIDVIDRDNTRHFFKLCTPAVPKGWIIERTRRAGEPDKVFCTVDCKINFKENIMRATLGSGL